MKKPLFDALVVLGIAVNIAFLLINLAPERPHILPPKKLKVVLRAGNARIAWMRENEFAEYAKRHDAQFELVTAATFEDVEQILRAEKDHPSGLALADIDDEHAAELRDLGLVRPIADGATPAELTAALDEYIPEAVQRGKLSGVQWYLPKRALVDVGAYLRPAVEDAYLRWTVDRPAIEAALREANGVGLPRGYTLEKSPEDWDTFDLFVAGYYWAHHPAPWAEQAVAMQEGAPALTAPRIAYPCGDNEDATDELLNSFYRHGMTDDTVEKLDGPAVVDTLQWRALFRKHGLIPARCAGTGLSTGEVNALFHDRRLAWVPIDQADSFWLHGGSRRDAPAGMPGAGDLQWATQPRGVSAALDAHGAPARLGRSFSFNEVHLWAVPRNVADVQTSFRLARFMDQRGLQLRETEAEGMLPIRADLRRDYPVAFRLDWMQRMLDASFRQIERGSGDTPAQWADKGFDDAYASLRKAVVDDRPLDAQVSLAAIRAAVAQALPAARKAQAEATNAR